MKNMILKALILIPMINLILSINLFAQESDKLSFFVFNNGVEDKDFDTPEKQVDLLKKTGFDGMEKKGIDGLERTINALEDRDLQLFTIYININLDDEQHPYDPRLEEVFKLIEGKATMPWFYITSKKYKPSSSENDKIALPIIREIADMANKYGVKVMIYPHVNFWVHNVQDAIRVVKKADRKNLGLTFNLCHFLADTGVQSSELFPPLLEKSMPYVFAISLNGADTPTQEIINSGNLWNHLIQPLGEGDYNTFDYLKAFTDRGFDGPVGLQCYNIKEEKPVHLNQSMTTWKAYQKKLGAKNITR
ncbi:MAG: sugar phosphate isomerase/epimerase [Cyclobacteriaceae bacterium]